MRFFLLALPQPEFAVPDHAAETHVPVMIYPNPWNPGRYIVLNSGFTFRGYGSNATQTPKLPDYAVIDTRLPADETAPGALPLAGFFDEQWGLEHGGGR